MAQVSRRAVLLGIVGVGAAAGVGVGVAAT